MCRKLIFLISLVLVLGLASSVSATDYHWTNDDPLNVLYTSPWNWDPVGVPSSCYDRAYIPSAGPIVIDTDVTVDQIRGPAWGGGADQDMYLIKDCNLVVCDSWRVEETVPYTGTIWVADNAKVTIGRAGDDYSFRAHGEHSRVIMNVTDNADIVLECDMKVGDEHDDYFELNMDSGYMSVGNCDDGWRQNEGEVHVDLSGDAVVEAKYIRFRCRTAGTFNEFNVREDAQLTVTDGDFRFAGGLGVVEINITDNAVVEVDRDVKLAEDDGFDATCTLNMSGQLLSMNGDFRIVSDGDARGFVTVNLCDGVIEARALRHRRTDNWIIDIHRGVMILDGDVTAAIAAHVAAGRITAYAGCGEVLYDYGETNPGKTTVMAAPPTVNAGGPYIAQATSWDGAEVQLNGAVSCNPDVVPLTYEWDLDLSMDSDGDGDPMNDTDATGPNPTELFPIGQRDISLVVSGWGCLGSERDVTTVTVSVMEVDIDIKPQSCPNPLELTSKGVLPVAVLGTEDLDVTTIDPETVGLSREGVEDDEGNPVVVKAIRYDYEDVATPFEGELCDCHDLNGDGYVDLTLKFSRAELVEKLKLDEVAGETVPLTLTGNLQSEEPGEVGTPIRGQDCIWVLES